MEWSEWLAAGLHARNRWRLPVLMVGMLFASGRRTVTTWLRAAGVSDDYLDYYYLSISQREMDQLAASGRIPRIRIDKSVWFDIADLDDFTDGKRNAPGQKTEHARNRGILQGRRTILSFVPKLSNEFVL